MIDEDIFFEWIKRITCIKKIEGAGEELYLDLVEHDLEYEDMKNLIALFYRYKINMKQLAKFVNEKNKDAVTPWQKEILKNRNNEK